MSSFSDRLTQRMHDLRLKQVDIYQRIGVSKGTVSGWVNGTMNDPRGDNLEKLAQVLKCSQKWLIFGDKEDSPYKSDLNLDTADLGETANLFINIPIYNIELSAGSGYSAGHEAITDEYPIHHSVLSKMGIDQQEAAIVKVRGESMTDTLWDGDMVLIQTTDKTPTSHKIYAFRLDDELRVKRFVKQLDGSWRVVSDNTDKTLYPDEVISSHTVSQLQILGRVRRIIDREM